RGQSDKNPTLRFFVDNRCLAAACAVELDVTTPAAGKKVPIRIKATTGRGSTPVLEVVSTDRERQKLVVPIDRADLSPTGEFFLRLEVRDAEPQGIKGKLTGLQHRRLDLYGLRLVRR